MIDYSYVKDISLWDRLGIDRLCNEVLYFDQWYTHYHTSEHTNWVMEYIYSQRHNIHIDLYEMAMIAAFFHDIGYDPADTDPVDTALIIFDDAVKDKSIPEYRLIRTAIESTRYNNLMRTDLAKLLARADCQDIVRLNYPRIGANNYNMVKEYQRYSFFDFRNGNEQVLANVGDSMLMRDVFNQAIAFNKGFYRMNRFNFAIYAGTFNPFHIGHKSVLMKAYPLFDKIVIATPKVTGRVSLSPQEVLGRRFEVIEFDGLFPDFVNRYIQIYPNVKFTIIRGIRHSLDLQYEQDLQKYYKELGLPANVDIVYMSADPKVAHISGTAVRDIMKVNPDKAKQYIPDPL